MYDLIKPYKSEVENNLPLIGWRGLELTIFDICTNMFQGFRDSTISSLLYFTFSRYFVALNEEKWIYESSEYRTEPVKNFLNIHIYKKRVVHLKYFAYGKKLI